jgi:hypothetical protein
MTDEQSPDDEPQDTTGGAKFWWRWQWVHKALGHTQIIDHAAGGQRCSCGMKWE